MSVQINKNQLLTTGLHDAIMLEAQQAIAYLPAEDKVNMALALVGSPKVDDPKTLTNMVIDLKSKLEEAENLISALQAKPAQVVSPSVTTTKP